MKFAIALLALLALLVPFSNSIFIGSKGEKVLVQTFHHLLYTWPPFVLFWSADNKVMVCYYGSWAVYRNGAGKFDVDQIDPL